jgi:magnesium-dependent phosphatase-1
VLRPISLIVFDADDTLWRGLDGGYISGRSYQEPGEEHFTFTPAEADLIVRDDGQRFELFPEVRGLLAELHTRRIPVSLASYNMAGPLFAALAAFEIDAYFRHPVVEWSSRKDLMLQTIIARFQADDLPIGTQNTLFIDDDRYGLYRRQMADIGVAFLQKDADILDLRDLLDHPEYPLAAV